MELMSVVFICMVFSLYCDLVFSICKPQPIEEKKNDNNKMFDLNPFELLKRADIMSGTVQAKRYSKSVGIKAVQEALGAVKHYNASKAIVITNSKFTQDARELADSNDVELWDRATLFEIILLTHKRIEETSYSQLSDCDVA